MAEKPPELAIDFDPLHTLGFLGTDWIEAHCRVPGGVYEGEPLVFNGWQLYCVANHYRVRPKAVYDRRKLLAPWVYRRSVIVGPQKAGKSPWGAAVLMLEAVGPSLFAGFACGGERYRCSDHGCGCGWGYEYLPGEAMGIPRSRPLLGLLAYAETQTDNVYAPLQSMILSGPLQDVMRVREGFIRTPNRGKIVPLTSKARSKLGQPLTGGLADESGLYTLANGVTATWQTMRRGIAAMQGRTIELTNPWDPMENSAAQQAFESRKTDIFRYYRKPPTQWSYANKRDRRKIHRWVYADSPWVDPDAVGAEADELVETDPTQAERFFGNRLVQGLGAYLTDALVEDAESDVRVPDGAPIAIGFDGSRSSDWTSIRAETLDTRHRFTPTYGPDGRPTVWRPEQWPSGRIPRGEVDAALDELHRRYTVVRGYYDPRHFETQIDSAATKYGDEKVVQWPTNQISRMHPALTRYLEDLAEKLTTHEPDEVYRTHALSARKVAKPGDKYILGKPAPHMKIDVLMSDILAHEAAADAIADGWGTTESIHLTIGW